MAKYLKIRSEWTGGDTRQDAASLYAKIEGAARFDTTYGVGYVVRPGGGTTGNDGERIESMSLSDEEFKVKWQATGGQGHTITLKFVDDANTGYTVGSTGPQAHAPSGIVDSETDHLR